MKQDYIETVRLLIDIAPDIFESPRFAMKGGTALNLFLQDMPRLSVDIDVVFVDHTLSRDDALQAIASDLHNACVRLEQRGYDVAIPKRLGGEDVTLFVRSDMAEVKVEVNPIFRGALLPIEKVSLVPAAQALFTANITVPMLSRAEVYGGKLVAAIDRQHPRDIFDVLKMYETFGLEADFVDCFVAYLAGHNRPVHEVLFSADAQFDAVYNNHFRGMTREEIALDTLLQTRTQLKQDLPNALTSQHKDFLLSLVKGEPAWELMPFPNLRDLPALKWKLLNLKKLKAAKPEVFSLQHVLLQERLDSIRN